jgi:hypothetical protein
MERETVPAGAVGLDRFVEIEPVGDDNAVGDRIDADDEIVMNRSRVRVGRQRRPRRKGDRGNGEP